MRAWISVAAVVGMWASCCCSQNAAELTEVRAEVRSALGRPYGASFVILDGRQARVCVGVTDNLGEIHCNIPGIGQGDEVTLVVFSLGFMRNTMDELCISEWWNRADWKKTPRCDVFVGEAGKGEDSKYVHFGSAGLCWAAGDGQGKKCVLRSPEDVVKHFGKNHAVALWLGTGPRPRCECVARTKRSTGRTIDFGAMCFPTTRAAGVILVDLEDSEGNPWRHSVVLGGHELPDPDWIASHKNNVYPHFALAQRGSRVRIIATRAGCRLLMANKSHFALTVVDETKQGPGASVRIPVPDDAAQMLWNGREVHLKVAMGKDGQASAGVTFPDYWDFLESSFDWYY